MTALVLEAVAGALIQLARHPADRLSDEHEAALEAILDREVGNAWFSTYEPQRHCRTLREGTALAAAILEAHARGAEPEAALSESGALACRDAWYAARDVAKDIVDGHEKDLGDVTRSQHSALIAALAERIETMLIDADTSRPRDALSSHDRAEVVFVFTAPGKHDLDGSIASHRPWPEFGELYVNDDLAHALACLGFTVGQYRKASGNVYQSDRARGAFRLRRPGIQRPTTPLCTLQQVEELVDNACAMHFLFCVYAIVPIAQLLDIDSARPMTFSKAAVATWNPWEGTFHDAAMAQAVTVTPNMGKLIAPAHLYSPDSICGLGQRYYEADLTSPPTAH
jgi:hypothetical protein